MIKEFAFLAYLFGGTSSPHHDTFKLHSPAFRSHMAIPQTYTCQGNNASIPLHWHNQPSRTKSLVLVMRDLSNKNTKNKPKVHWSLYNLPPQLHFLTANNTKHARGEKFGLNSWGEPNYHGPCSTVSRHHYDIKLYALNTYLELPNHATIQQLTAAIHHHVIATATLDGYYGHHQNPKKPKGHHS